MVFNSLFLGVFVSHVLSGQYQQIQFDQFNKIINLSILATETLVFVSNSNLACIMTYSVCYVEFAEFLYEDLYSWIILFFTSVAMSTFNFSVLNKAIALIKQAQGFRAQVYMDSLGNQTIGYGHKLRPNEIGKLSYITQQKAEQLMLSQLQSAQKQMKNYWESSLSPMNDQRIAVLLDMVYNCGSIRWPKLTKAVRQRNWQQAAQQILDSKYKEQVKIRAYRNAQIMRSGVMCSYKEFVKTGNSWVIKDDI